MKKEIPSQSPESIEPGSYAHRFGGIERLYGEDAQLQIKQTRFAIIGLGGVGSWAAEALARSGVGEITLIDWDDICFSNTNRQIHAHTGTPGKAKVEVLADRIHHINPSCRVHAIRDFYTAQNAETLLSSHIDYVLDAIDRKNAKIHLITFCYERGIPVITCGGAGGRIDPSQIRTADLGESDNDPLLAQLRKQLRKPLGLPREQRVHFGIPCVYSAEPMRYPTHDRKICLEKPKETTGPRQLDCAAGFGSASFVTGSFGFAMAAYALNDLLLRKDA